jgi:hypothetical protein
MHSLPVDPRHTDRTSDFKVYGPSNMFPIDNPFVADSEKLKFGRIFTSPRQALVISGVDGLTSDIPGLMESPQLQLFQVMFYFIEGVDIRVQVGSFEHGQRLLDTYDATSFYASCF